MMRWVFIAWMVWVLPTSAQDLSGLARVDPGQSKITKTWGGDTKLRLDLTQGVPYKIITRADPNRIIVDFQVVVFDGLDADDFQHSSQVQAVSFGAMSSQASRMVLHLAEPMAVTSAEMKPDGFFMTLTPVGQEQFSQNVTPDAPQRQISMPPMQAKQRPDGSRKWVVALDPGHGGIDPGADGGRRSEADLMLQTGFELQDRLRKTGLFEVVMTRTDDVFVGLEERMSIARTGNADVFLSLHADAVTEGVAVGSTVYILSSLAGSQADAKLAARHNNSDILAGVDLTGQGDEIARVLLDMVRRENAPRADALANALIEGIKNTGAPISSKPRRQGDFAVLRSADIPSVLIELGFLSSPSDRDRLNTLAGRNQVIDGIVDALKTWSRADAAAAALIRQ